jgi:hypothetical protein
LFVAGAVGGVVGVWTGPPFLSGAGWGPTTVLLVGLVTLYGVIFGSVSGFLGGRLVGRFDEKVVGNGDLRPAEVVGGFLWGVVGPLVVLPILAVVMSFVFGGLKV